jgi:streptomycin 3"-adenylyltransferase
MSDSVPAEILVQLSQVRAIIEHRLAPTLLALHLYGSALDGDLKPYSDIDLLATVTIRPDKTLRQALMIDLLKVSAPPGKSKALRALEVTVVVRNDIVPWHYPAKRELQFGEWLRKEILAGTFEPPVIDPDLAILLTKVRQKSIALVGPPAESFFDPVPESDLYRALSDTLKLWDSPPSWTGDERNVVLTLARIWYSAATGKITPKAAAADWVMERLPVEHQPILFEAQQIYLGHCEDHLASRGDQLTAFILHVTREITKVLNSASKDKKTGQQL